MVLFLLELSRVCNSFHMSCMTQFSFNSQMMRVSRGQVTRPIKHNNTPSDWVFNTPLMLDNTPGTEACYRIAAVLQTWYQSSTCATQWGLLQSHTQARSGSIYAVTEFIYAVIGVAMWLKFYGIYTRLIVLPQRALVFFQLDALHLPRLMLLRHASTWKVLCLLGMRTVQLIFVRCR